jgi:hypothetical protein
MDRANSLNLMVADLEEIAEQARVVASVRGAAARA